MDIQAAIAEQADWAAQTLAAEGYALTYTIRSFAEVDRLFAEHSVDGRATAWLRAYPRRIMFALGAYVGETLRQALAEAHWQLENVSFPQNENIGLHLPNGAVCWPMNRVINRLHHGEAYSIYSYGSMLSQYS